MSGDYVQIPGSYREAPTETPVATAHAATPSEPVEISVYLKDREPDPLLQQRPITAAEAAASKKGAVPRSSDVSAQRASNYAEEFAKIAAFARETGLSIVKQDPARRLVKLSGPIDKLEAAFRTKLHYYNDGKQA